MNFDADVTRNGIFGRKLHVWKQIKNSRQINFKVSIATITIIKSGILHA